MIFHPFKNRPKILEQENPLDRFQVVAPQIRWMERGGGEEEGGEGGIALGNRYWNKGSPHCISVITLIINRRRGEQCRNRVWPKYWRRRQNLVTIAATMDIRPAHGDLSRRSTMPGLANQTSHEIWALEALHACLHASCSSCGSEDPLLLLYYTLNWYLAVVSYKL